MSSKVCRFCFSSSTKLEKSLNDELIVKFLDVVPQIALSEDRMLSDKICQLCYGKVKISCDLISKILETQMQLGQKKNVRRINTIMPSASEVVKKIQRNSGISIKMMQPVEEIILCSSPESGTMNEYCMEPPVVNFYEASSDDEVQFTEINIDSDDDYVPSRSATKKSTEKSTRSRYSNKSHVFIDTPISFTCAKCKNSFESFEILSAHMKEKTCFKETFECPLCRKTFQSKRSLTSHSHTHNPKPKIVCEECDLPFKSHFDLNVHREQVHHETTNVGGITFRCSHCQSVCTSHSELLEHVKEHQKDQNGAPRLCEICARICRNQKAYTIHVATHLPKKRPFLCEICSKGFTKNFLLTQHMHVHNGVKAFSCDQCPKKFAKKDSLRIHNKKQHSSQLMKKIVK